MRLLQMEKNQLKQVLNLFDEFCCWSSSSPSFLCDDEMCYDVCLMSPHLASVCVSMSKTENGDAKICVNVYVCGRQNQLLILILIGAEDCSEIGDDGCVVTDENAT